ncbi:hypothetical protein J6500_00280 [Bradyrhizobium sp. WSM 1704]|uniref:hypothetical protein n=1 Tax=Bradyrhizobium semiaridum TaxID=2821404 RepID=UPI001CE32819|nr:hypothetical protein [Bradyrhizobium semiaridum]MCA6120346.1 hypothetical protein [Bradyrhizobium semiaridum]
MVLKLLFKLFIEQQVKPVDVAKAILAFPIDIAFLSFSFGAAILYAKPPSTIHTGTVREMFVVLLLSIMVLMLCTVLAKKSDMAFTLNKFAMMFLLVILAYVVSIVAVWGALNVGAIQWT